MFFKEKGGCFIIATVSKDTKYFVNQYGTFYEGQVLQKHCYCHGRLCFDKSVILDKFIVHYDKVYRNKQKLYFRFYPEGKKNKYYMATLSADCLGTIFKNSIDF